MIKKLPEIQIHSCAKINEKLNEVIDVVNKHQDILRQIGEWGSEKGEILWCETLTEFKPNPYAEQRKWIGCVCRFWFDNPNHTALDYLEEIKTGKNGIEYYSREIGDWFPHCEPVKPDDDIIFKGE